MERVEEGQGMVEYALVITLVALAVVASLALLGPAVQGSIRAGIAAFP
jgi:Flp pilus assembly pilin Flp